MDTWKHYRRTGKWGWGFFFINFVEERLLTFFFYLSCRERFLDFEMAPGNAIDELVSRGWKVFFINFVKECLLTFFFFLFCRNRPFGTLLEAISRGRLLLEISNL